MNPTAMPERVTTERIEAEDICRFEPGAIAGADASGYRWVALFIVWGAFLLSYIDRVAWSTVAAPVGASLGLNVSMLGAFVTAFYAGYVVANVIGGALTDLLGGRAMMTLALLPLGVFTFYFGETQTLSAGIVIQLAMGLAAGADYSAGMKIISAWFTKDRGRAMGIYTTATSLAVVLANGIVPSLSVRHGWSNAFRVLGVVTFTWGIVSLLLLKNGPLSEKHACREQHEGHAASAGQPQPDCARDRWLRRSLGDGRLRLVGQCAVDQALRRLAGCGGLDHRFVRHWRGDRQADARLDLGPARRLAQDDVDSLSD